MKEGGNFEKLMEELDNFSYNIRYTSAIGDGSDSFEEEAEFREFGRVRETREKRESMEKRNEDLYHI